MECLGTGRSKAVVSQQCDWSTTMMQYPLSDTELVRTIVAGSATGNLDFFRPLAKPPTDETFRKIITPCSEQGSENSRSIEKRLGNSYTSLQYLTALSEESIASYCLWSLANNFVEHSILLCQSCRYSDAEDLWNIKWLNPVS